MLFKHSAQYFLARLVPAIVTLMALAIYTRLLSPAEYGSYSLTIVVAMGLNAIVFQWINLALGRFLPECESPELRNHWISTAVYVWFFLALLIIALAISLPLHSWLDQFAIIFWLLGILAAAQAWFELAQRFDNIALRPLRYGMASLIKSLLALCFGFLALSVEAGVTGVLLTLALALFLSSFIQREDWSVAKLINIDFNVLRQMLVYGFPLTLAFLMTFIIDVCGRLFLNLYAGVDAVGLFSAAYEFVQYIVGTLLAVVHLAAFPLLVRLLRDGDRERITQQLMFNFELVIAIAAAVCLGLVLCREEISGLIFGSEFRAGAITIIPLIALALFLSVLKSYYFDYAFQLGKNTLLQLVTVILGALMTVASCAFFVPHFGLVGAAIASCVGFASALLASAIIGLKVFPMPRLNIVAIGKIGFASLCMSLLLSLVPELPGLYSLLVKVTLGAVIYVGVLILTNYMQLRRLIKDRYFAK